MSELTKRVRAKYPGVYDDMDDATLEKAVLAKHPEYADLAQPTEAKPSAAAPKPSETPSKIGMSDLIGAVAGALHAVPGLSSMLGERDPTVMNAVREHPIESGAMLGGAVAAPLTGGASIPAAMAAAGLGGAGGAGLGMIANAIAGQADSPTTAGGVLSRMGSEGATQATAEGAGRLVSKGAQAIAKQMYRGALRPSAAIRLKYPNVIEQGLADKAVVGSQQAPLRMRGMMTASRDAADAMVEQQAARDAAAIPREDITRGLTRVEQTAEDTAKAAGLPSEASRVTERAAALPESFSLQEAHRSGRLLSDKADAAFKAAQRGGPPPSLDAQIDKALASGYSNAVKDRVPGLAAQNAITSTRYGLAKALNAAAERPSVLGNIVAGTTGVGTFANTQDPEKALLSALAVKGMFSPRGLSTGAIGLNMAAKAPISNIFRAALLSKLFGQEEQP